MIHVKAQMNNCGWVKLSLESEHWRKKFGAHMLKWTGSDDTSILIQNDSDVQWFIREIVPPGHRRDLKEGWPVRFNMDSWVYGSMLGWDAASITYAKKGE